MGGAQHALRMRERSIMTRSGERSIIIIIAAQIKMTVSFPYLAIVVALCYCFVRESSCQTSLSSQDQQELLDAHNHYRGIVTPTASDMQTMVTVSIAESNLLRE